MRTVFSAILFLMVCNYCAASLQTKITCSVRQIQETQWAYSYQIENLSLEAGIREFTIWFDQRYYSNLTIVSKPELSANWDQIVWQPNPAAAGNGAFDALTLGEAIFAGQSASGFAVMFDWAGLGGPGGQSYEIINPDTFEIIEAGYTVLVPEPASVMILILGAAWAGIKRKR